MADNLKNKDQSTSRTPGDTTYTREAESTTRKDENRDPLSGAPGAHPVGTGIGAASAGAAGAAIGSVAGPIGTAVGAAVGAVAGGLAGKAVAEAVDPTAEDAYWRENYTRRPYYQTGYAYEEYAPAYRYGWESRGQYVGRRFEEVDSNLERGWDKFKGKSRLTWDKAKLASRDAWDRIERAMPGDADRDGR